MKNTLLVFAVLSSLLFQYSAAQYRPNSSLLTEGARQKMMDGPGSEMKLESGEKKSVLLAIFASLVLPGLGEYYVDSFESGKYNFYAEAGLWFTYAGFHMYSNWLRQDARSFAVKHAGADFNGKDDQYSVNIGNFISTEEYNDAKTRNREYDLIYFTDARPDYLWKWDSDANRANFKDIRIKSDGVKNNAKFVVGAIVINHVISAFSAGRKAARHNKSVAAIENIDMHAYMINTGSVVDGMGVNISAEF